MKKIIVLLLSVLIVLTSCMEIDNTDEETKGNSINADSKSLSSCFEVTMIDVNQGLCILIKSGEEYMIYDGGGRSTSSTVVSYLLKNGINKIKYMFVSHYDEDHIAGLIGVLNRIDVNTIVDPNYEADSDIYSSFKKMASRSGAMEVHPVVGDEFVIGDAKISVIGPRRYNNQDENNNSVAIRITAKDFSVIITGDAGYDEEIEMLSQDIKSDLYVVGHHGSNNSSCYHFLREMAPQYAFISVGANNSYGHPTEEVLSRLEDADCQIYRTDLQGTITAFYDGNKIWFSQEAIQKIKEEQTQDQNKSDYNYVLNTSSKKFHLPSCGSVNQMAEHNKNYSTSSREELIQQGYSPCGNCQP